MRVATSTMTAGSRWASANAMASAITTRPSASVFTTSVVRPPYCRTTSPGRYDAAPRAFSASGRSPTTRRRTPAPGHATQRCEDGGGAGHVRLHRHHRLARLDVEAAGVEGDPLADEDDRPLEGGVRGSRPTPHRGGGRPVLQPDQAGRACRAAADGEQPAEALGGEALLVPHLDLEAGGEPGVHRLGGQPDRILDVGGRDGEPPGEQGGRGVHAPAFDGVPRQVGGQDDGPGHGGVRAVLEPDRRR